MSGQEAAQPPAPLAEVKPKPDLPPKPTERPSSLPLEEDDRPASPSGVNVKRIVNKFSKHRVERQMKRQPVIRPKPSTGGTAPPHPPPLPKKRTRLPHGKSTESEDGDGICAEGSRSGTRHEACALITKIFNTPKEKKKMCLRCPCALQVWQNVNKTGSAGHVTSFASDV